MMRRQIVCVALLAALAAVSTHAQTVVLFSENFDGVTLGPTVWEPDGQGANVLNLATFPNAYTHTAPAGWTNDQSGVPGLDDPTKGVPEWKGWSFANKDWWATVAGDQNRTQFVNGSGTVAVVDPDEWDDFGNPEALGAMDASIYTPAIDLSAITSGLGQLTFDSSWRPEDMQSAQVNVSYDGGATYQTLLNWSSDSGSADYHGSATNESVMVPFTQPAEATQAIFEFRGYDMTDDWWWAVDNIAVGNAGGTPVFTEDFESCTLGPPSWEPNGLAADTSKVELLKNAFTHEGPADWTVVNTDIPAGGVPEWEGWSFANKDYWVMVGGDQNRSYFTKGQNVVAVVDPDEWEDSGPDEGTYTSALKSPLISVKGMERVTVDFDSSWRPEDDQKARLIAKFDVMGPPATLLYWTSQETDSTFHPDAENESLSFTLDVPAGATSVYYEWKMLDAGNDWWWAIDNVVVKGVVPEPGTLVLLLGSLLGLGLLRTSRVR